MVGLSRGTGLSTLVSVQYLRAFAALIVVYYHVFSNRVAEHWSAGHDLGILGVDIFFIISGFIMWLSTSHQQGGVLRFLRRRALRIYPLWWIALTVWIVSRLIQPDRLHNADLTPHALIGSYLLLPHFHAVFAGRIWPILVPGWTLQLEIFFYLLFGLCLLQASRGRRLALALGLLCLLAAMGILLAPRGAIPGAYTNPLLLEFAAGILIASCLARIERLPVALGLLAIGLGLLALLLDYSWIVDSGLRRVIVLGVPAAFIVCGALALEPLLDRHRNRFFLLLGDASYSLYLTHSVAISAAAVVWEKLHLPTGRAPGAMGFVPVAMIVSVVVAIFVYRWVEAPLLARLLRGRGSRPQAPALPSEALAEEAS